MHRTTDLETAFEEADLVFIGIVVELSNHDRTAEVEVEQGEEQPFNVVVHGGPTETDLFTSVDRTFELGTYIFFPVNSTPPFEDNACTLNPHPTDLRSASRDQPLWRRAARGPRR